MARTLLIQPFGAGWSVQSSKARAPGCTASPPSPPILPLSELHKRGLTISPFLKLHGVCNMGTPIFFWLPGFLIGVWFMLWAASKYPLKRLPNSLLKPHLRGDEGVKNGRFHVKFSFRVKNNLIA